VGAAAGERRAPTPVDRPRAARGLRRRELAFDRAEIDARLGSVDSHRLRPRYQSDLLDEADRARLDAEFPCAEPGRVGAAARPGARRGRTRCRPRPTRCCSAATGGAQSDEVLAPLPAEAHDDARACLAQLAAPGCSAD
jgi:hypothetical protein